MTLLFLTIIWLLVSSQPSDDWTKVAVAVSGGCSLGLLVGAWATVQYGKSVWLSIARDWSRTDEFEAAVVKSAAEKIRTSIEEHNEEEFPHPKWRHNGFQTELAKVSRGHWEAEKDKRP